MNLFLHIRNNDADAIRTAVAANESLLSARDERGSTPLVLASYLGHLDATRVLVEAGADLNEQGSTGSALMGVTFKGFVDIARYLLEAGADPNVRHENGMTALGFARQFGQPEVEKILLEYGATE